MTSQQAPPLLPLPDAPPAGANNRRRSRRSRRSSSSSVRSSSTSSSSSSSSSSSGSHSRSRSRSRSTSTSSSSSASSSSIRRRKRSRSAKRRRLEPAGTGGCGGGGDSATTRRPANDGFPVQATAKSAVAAAAADAPPKAVPSAGVAPPAVRHTELAEGHRHRSDERQRRRDNVAAWLVGSNGTKADFKKVISQLLVEEFAQRASERAIQLLTHICESLCRTETDMRVFLEAVEKALKHDQEANPRNVLTYWYALDAVLKYFRTKPAMVAVVVKALPHLLQHYVPWNASKPEESLAKYKHMFRTWRFIVPEELNQRIGEMVRVAELP